MDSKYPLYISVRGFSLNCSCKVAYRAMSLKYTPLIAIILLMLGFAASR